jgi:valyl-tRNA synthetase
MPFVTEEIWDALGTAAPDPDREPLLVGASWPSAGARDVEAEAAFDDLSELVRAVRNLRTASGAAAGAWLPLEIAPPDATAAAAIEGGRRYLEPLARVRPVTIGIAASGGDTATPLGAIALGSDAAGDQERGRRREAQRAELQAGIERVRALLANDAFIARAPAPVVEKERARLVELESQLAQL